MTPRRFEATQLISHFTTVLLLVVGFNSDLSAFMEFLATHCSPAQRAHDLPLLVRLKERAETDPNFIAKLNYLLAEFEGLVSPPLRRSDGGAQQQERAA